jgi:hypothetical protein
MEEFSCEFLFPHIDHMNLLEMDENTLHMSPEPRSAAEGKTIFC